MKKETNKPSKEFSKDRETAVILEKVYGEIKTITEGQDFLKKGQESLKEGQAILKNKVEALEVTTARNWMKLTEVDLRIIKVESTVGGIDTRLIKIDKSVGEIGVRFVNIEKDVQGIKSDTVKFDRRLDAVEARK